MNKKIFFDSIMTETGKKALPLLSFPSVSLMNVTVDELVRSSELQAKGMKMVADRVPSLASVSMMDLSVEAEAFGSPLHFAENEVPAVTDAIVTDMESAEALRVPEVGDARTGIYVRATELAKTMITDRPVFSGVIGPFSLAGRLVGVSEAMILCCEEPEIMEVVLDKATEFLIKYIKAYKAVGADGIVMAEPLAGLLSPALAEEFSEPYVKRIADAVKDDEFAVIYHNCGDFALRMTDSIVNTGCDAYHFGNSISMKEALELMPKDVPVMGNIDPAGQLRYGTPDSIREAVKKLMDECGGYKNFVPSSGCDIPHDTPWENLDAFFNALA